MDKRPIILSGAGVVLLGISVSRGGLSTGYGTGPIPVLLRIGFGYVALGVLSGLLRPLNNRKGALNAVVTTIVVFVVGVGIMYYDLGIHRPNTEPR